MTTEPTPVHDEACGHRAQTSETEDGEGAGAGAGTSVPEHDAGAATPQPEVIAQPSAPPSPARRPGGPMLAAPASPGRLDLEPIRRWIANFPTVHEDDRRAHRYVGQLLDEVDEVRAIEMAALVLLRASGPGTSWGEHVVAERMLRDLLEVRGHDVGEKTA